MATAAMAAAAAVATATRTQTTTAPPTAALDPKSHQTSSLRDNVF